jgi:HK97 family phage portal protein
MGLMQRLADWTGIERRDDRRDPSWSALAPGIGFPATLSAHAAENLSAVLACTTAISSALAYVPALVYRQGTDGNRVEATAHPLRRITRYGASEAMTWPDFLEHLIASALLTGNGLAEVVRSGNGQLAGFNWIPWGMVTVVYLSSGRLAFDVSDGRGNSRRLLQSEVLHLRDRTDDGLVGRSRLSRAAETVQGVQSSNTFARGMLDRGMSPSGVISVEGILTDEQRRQLREGMMERHEGARNAGRTLVLDGGLKWNACQISPEDAELLETRKFGIIEVCRLFQVPPPIVQAYENNTFTNAAQAGLWFGQFTLAPWARKIEAEFARTVFPAGGAYELELDLSGFLRGDPATRWAAHKIAIDTGVLDADEVRQVEGWNARAKPAAVDA